MDDANLLTVLGPRAALSHQSAARRWGLELLDDDGSHHVTVPRSRGRARIGGVRVHRADLKAIDIEMHEEIRLTAVLRTVLDLGRTLSLVAAVVTADSALRQRLLSPAELTSATARALGRGSGRLRAMAELADANAGSVLETLLRVLLVTNGVPRPLSQFSVLDRAGGFVGRVDFCWPQARLIVEADGYAFHADRDSYRRDRERLNRLEQLGWRVLRFSWEDVVGRPDYVLALVRSFWTTLPPEFGCRRGGSGHTNQRRTKIRTRGARFARLSLCAAGQPAGTQTRGRSGAGGAEPAGAG